VNSKPGRSPVVVLVAFGCLADWNQTQQQPQAAGQQTTLPAVQSRTAQCACAAYVAVRPTHRYTILTLALAIRPRTVGNDEKIREAIAKRRQTRETKRANVSVFC